MKKILILFAALALNAACQSEASKASQTAALSQKLPIEAKDEPKDYSKMTSLHSFKAQTIDGQEFDFSTLKGKRVLIVNTASECGFTPQYEDLQALHEQYAGDKFAIIGFPSNDFGGQEPGSDEEIAAFCQKNYGVGFQMMSKVKVRGEDSHPVYQWLCNKSLNGVDDAKVKWNFNKFLIDENGHWVAHYGSMVGPLNKRIVAFAQGE